MQVRGPLMIEHRLIEKMIARIAREIKAIEKTGNVDPLFIDTAVDFIRMYADRTHHGKEEEILFADLGRKDLDDENRRLMDELVAEHAFGRKITGELVAAKNAWLKQDPSAAETILDKLKTLIGFYPEHIRKEDKVFFPAVMAYFSDQEQSDMLSDFWEFDRKMIHEKYEKVIDELEQT